MSSGTASWSGAQEACQRINGTLAIISNDDVKSFVRTLVASTYSAWIGAFRPPGGSNPKIGWEWEDGTPWRCEDWASGEPKGDGYCVSYFSPLGGRWNDASCAIDYYQYVCQKKCKGMCYYYPCCI